MRREQLQSIYASSCSNKLYPWSDEDIVCESFLRYQSLRIRIRVYTNYNVDLSMVSDHLFIPACNAIEMNRFPSIFIRSSILLRPYRRNVSTYSEVGSTMIERPWRALACLVRHRSPQREVNVHIIYVAELKMQLRGRTSSRNRVIWCQMIWNTFARYPYCVQCSLRTDNT